ncbi:YtxH domain-containing protein [Mesobacillus zeae]|uniref:YtxH domain-containing protein n=1 Tax=Mesobacillus zeae TaxID=1917180 RepID=A0A398B6S9_9BACI|nr:YtxH domain-containing protein [Mesobacillus zeae]RID85174.1 YtxH domain-containing protein [Mesobacillus zeae]
MGNSKKFWMWMGIGAAVGAALSLCDKTTRASVKEDLGKVSGTAMYIAKDPKGFASEVKDSVNKVRTAVEQVVDDVAFIAEKVDEIRDVPPQVADIMKETKEAIGKISEKANNQEQQA